MEVCKRNFVKFPFKLKDELKRTNGKHCESYLTSWMGDNELHCWILRGRLVKRTKRFYLTLNVASIFKDGAYVLRVSKILAKLEIWNIDGDLIETVATNMKVIFTVLV